MTGVCLYIHMCVCAYGWMDYNAGDWGIRLGHPTDGSVSGLSAHMQDCVVCACTWLASGGLLLAASSVALTGVITAVR